MIYGEREGYTNSPFSLGIKEGANPMRFLFFKNIDKNSWFGRFLNRIAGPHDFFQEPWYVNGDNIPRFMPIDIIRDVYSYTTMIPAAVYTPFAIYGQYLQGAVYDLTSDKENK
jgi:hypothetical protein